MWPHPRVIKPWAQSGTPGDRADGRNVNAGTETLERHRPLLGGAKRIAQKFPAGKEYGSGNAPLFPRGRFPKAIPH